MTTQQTPREVIAQLTAFIDQQEVARASAQALALQWQATADAQRRYLDQALVVNRALQADIASVCDERDALARQLAKAQRRIAELEGV